MQRTGVYSGTEHTSAVMLVHQEHKLKVSIVLTSRLNRLGLPITEISLYFATFMYIKVNKSNIKMTFLIKQEQVAVNNKWLAVRWETNWNTIKGINQWETFSVLSLFYRRMEIKYGCTIKEHSLYIFIECNLSWEADSRQGFQEIFCLLLNPKVHCRIAKSQTLASILIQINTVEYIMYQLPDIHFNVIVPFMPMHTKRFTLAKFSVWNLVCVSDPQ
jgi:hypothetical protein